jgi:hypothetical protein
LGEPRLFSFALVDRAADPVATCAAEIASVAWSTDRPSILSVAPDPTSRSRALATGLARGEAAVTARITFRDGSEGAAVPAAVTVGAASGP